MADRAPALTYLNDLEARTVEAIAERIIPADERGLGATRAGVVYYIDRAISGFSTNLQRLYRLGLRELDLLSEQEFSARFLDLGPEQQDHIVGRLLGPASGAGGLAQPEDTGTAASRPGLTLLRRFLNVVREHTIEGFFCDPVYGGNRDAVGWRLVGFPGAQWGYTAEQMQPGFDATSIPIKTLADLRAELAVPPANEQFYLDPRKG